MSVFALPILQNLERGDLSDIFEVLTSRGGFCDCEILYNAAGDNKLKSEYWRSRAAGQEPRTPHNSSK
jgi:hypothetical protein